MPGAGGGARDAATRRPAPAARAGACRWAGSAAVEGIETGVARGRRAEADGIGVRAGRAAARRRRGGDSRGGARRRGARPSPSPDARHRRRHRVRRALSRAWSRRLRAIPVAVEEAPLMTFAPPLDWRPVDAALARPRGASTRWRSPRPDRRGAFAGRVSGAGGADGVASATAIWAAGAGHRRRRSGDGLGAVRRPDERAVGERGAAAALAAAMLGGAASAGPVLFPCGDIRRDELPARLRDDGIEVEEVVCYRSVLAGESDARRGGGAGAGAGGGEPERGRSAGARLSAGRPARAARRGPDHRGGGARLGLAARGRGRTPDRRGARGRRPRCSRPLNRSRRMNDLFLRACRREPVERPPGLDDAPGRPLSPRVPRGARARRFPHDGAARRSWRSR